MTRARSGGIVPTLSLADLVSAAPGIDAVARIETLSLPHYNPELNPVERVWLYLRERFLSNRLWADYEAVVDARCKAWNALAAKPERLRSLTVQTDATVAL